MKKTILGVLGSSLLSVSAFGVSMTANAGVICRDGFVGSPVVSFEIVSNSQNNFPAPAIENTVVYGRVGSIGTLVNASAPQKVSADVEALLPTTGPIYGTYEILSPVSGTYGLQVILAGLKPQSKDLPFIAFLDRGPKTPRGEARLYPLICENL